MLKIKWAWKAFKKVMKDVPELCIAGRPCEIGISETQREEG